MGTRLSAALCARPTRSSSRATAGVSPVPRGSGPPQSVTAKEGQPQAPKARTDPACSHAGLYREQGAGGERLSALRRGHTWGQPSSFSSGGSSSVRRTVTKEEFWSSPRTRPLLLSSHSTLWKLGYFPFAIHRRNSCRVECRPRLDCDSVAASICLTREISRLPS